MCVHPLDGVTGTGEWVSKCTRLVRCNNTLDSGIKAGTQDVKTNDDQENISNNLEFSEYCCILEKSPKLEIWVMVFLQLKISYAPEHESKPTVK